MLPDLFFRRFHRLATRTDLGPEARCRGHEQVDHDGDDALLEDSRS